MFEVLLLERGEMPETSNGGEEFEMWELIWARSRAKDDWWPCQICEVSLFISWTLWNWSNRKVLIMM